MTIVYNGYYLMKKDQRRFYKKAMRNDLNKFWKAFNRSDKISLLKEYSEKRYYDSPQIYLIRKNFNTNIYIKKGFRSRCYVCGYFPTIPHHIIQIQNGGLNIKKNIIRICHECHAKIHPWIKVNFQNGSDHGLPLKRKVFRRSDKLTDSKQSGVFSGIEPRPEPEIKTIRPQDNINPIVLARVNERN
jgi:hypothetical protein